MKLVDLNLPAVSNDCRVDVDCKRKYENLSAFCYETACYSGNGAKLTGTVQ